ncbi:MAG: TonB-dependent receptor [Bacteroidales bacterium]|jgi:outer membrane receptor protein involved in Fe transport|nr:TonB-dependent receptor [Bacteroidales bacterium]
MTEQAIFFITKKIFLSLLLLLLSGISVFGQRGNAILSEAQKKVTDKTGVIVCSVSDQDGKPLEYTTIAVLNVKDSSVVAGGITNEAGRTFVDGLPWGTYLVRISYIGYSPLYVPNMAISKEKPVASTGRQQIQISAKNLEGVVVSAERSMIENNLDKRVFNVDKSIVTEGATGSDVLENIPSVTVDLDGNVSLRGSQSVTILIDGRPTDLSMDEIPANTIERIEVVTNPSARYEPDGTSGIINIVLKKERKLGVNASLSLGAGIANKKSDIYFGRYSANLDLSFRYAKFNFFFNYNFRSFLSNTESDLERENTFGEVKNSLTQHASNSWKGVPQGIRGGMDYFINSYNTVSIEGGYRYRKNYSETEMMSLTQDIFGDTLSSYTQNSYNTPIGTDSWNAAVNYTRTSKVKGRELVIDVSTSEHARENENIMTQYYRYPAMYQYHQKSNNGGKYNRVTAKLDFVTPLGDGGRLETGYRFNWSRNEETYRFFSGNVENELTEDSNRYDVSTYIDNVHAVYLVYANTIKEKLKYQLGLRAELAKTTSKLQSETEIFSPKPYFDLFPTLHLRYDFNDKHSLQGGYSIRIRRPRGHELNPFLNDRDKLNLSQGNRKLTPEYTHSADVGYLMILKKTTLSANVFYRYRYDIISRYTILINDSTTFTTYENLDNSHSYGLELSYQQDLLKFWKISLNSSLYQTFINSDSLYDASLSNTVTWQARINSDFSLPKDFNIQLTANYRSPIVTLNSMGYESGGAGQGIMSAVWGVDIGLRKSFFKRSLTISLRISDIFYTRNASVKSYGTTSYSDYTSTMYRYRDSRQLWLTVTYNIFNYKTKRQQQREFESEFEEM